MSDARKTYAILGMHRSGTSWLAGSLQEKGLELGEVNEAAKFNRRGNRESDEITNLHESILRASGGAWNAPPKRIAWTAEQQADLGAIIEKMNAAHARWGFKDPRALLLMSEWERQVPQGLEFVGVYRHPAEVARSLHARPRPLQVSVRQGIRLWRLYNDRLIEIHRRRPFPILRFDVAAPELLASLDAVAIRWGLPGGTAPGEFFNDELRQSAAGSSDRVPRSCRSTWQYLLEHTG